MPIPYCERVTASIGDTEDATDLGHSTIYQKIASGEIESVKIGGRRLIVVASVLRMLGLDRETAAAKSAAATQPVAGPRRRGRPPGSKNKPANTPVAA